MGPRHSKDMKMDDVCREQMRRMLEEARLKKQLTQRSGQADRPSIVIEESSP